MNARYGYSRTQSPTTWQDQAAEIKQAVKDRDRLLPIMTQYERLTVAEYIGGLKEKYRPTIEAGALAVWNDAKNRLKGALTIVEREKRKVTNSFDSSKLADEMTLYSMRIDQATKADAGRPNLADLDRLYQEAKDSGDPYKKRAAAEALQNIVSKIPAGNLDTHGNDVRFAANRLAKQAGRDLEKLRTSEGLAAAHELVVEKVAELNQAKSLLFDTADILGDLNPNGTLRNSPFIVPLASVIHDAEGNFIFKEILRDARGNEYVKE